MSHGHYQVLCKECDTVITQCRCPGWGKPKTTTYETCQQCKDAVFEKLKEDENEG